MIALTSAISTLSGLWGVLVTDMFQFVIKMSMVIILAVFAVNAVGGIEEMKTKLVAAGRGDALNIVPPWIAWMPMIAFFVYIGVNWWATWYPGAEPGGGGYIAQRISRPRTSGTRCSPRSGSTSRTMRSGRGRGSRRAGLADSLPWLKDPRQLHPGADRSLASGAPRSDGRRVRGCIHVDDRDAAQLGRELSGERLLPAVLEA